VERVDGRARQLRQVPAGACRSRQAEITLSPGEIARAPFSESRYWQESEIIFTDFTRSVSLFAALAVEPMALEAFLLALACCTVPVTSTLWPTCAFRLSPVSSYDIVSAAVDPVVPVALEA